MTDGLRHRPPIRVVVAAVLAVLAGGVGALMVVAGRDSGPLDGARAELADDGDFTRASDAGEAFNRASIHLETAARDCGTGTDACPELATAAAFARVGAVTLLRCTRPEIHRFRSQFRTYLDALAVGREPTPPRAPVC